MELTQVLVEIMREFNRDHAPEKMAVWNETVGKVKNRLYVLREQIGLASAQWQANKKYTEAEKGAFWIFGKIPESADTFTRNWWAEHGWIYDKKHPCYDPLIIIADELYQQMKHLHSARPTIFHSYISDAEHLFMSESKLTSWWRYLFQKKRLV